MTVDVRGYLLGKGLNLKTASGYEVHTACFFCGEDETKRGRLYVNTDPDAEIPGLFQCKRCDNRGALPSIKKFFGDVAEQEEETAVVRCDVLMEAARFYQERLTENEDVYAYLRGPERMLTVETIMDRLIGYAPDPYATSDDLVLRAESLGEYLTGTMGHTADEVIATGLCYKSQKGKLLDSLRGMVTIPYFVAGSCVSIRGRAWPMEPGQAKYKTLSGHAARLFNTDVLWEDHKEVVLCEGEFDAMVMEQLGLPAVAAPGANTWKDAWDRYFDQARRVWVVFDADEAGSKGVEKVQNHLGPKARRVFLDEPGAKCDPTMWVGRGKTAEDFAKIVAGARGGLLCSVDDAFEEHELLQSLPGLEFNFEQLDNLIAPGLQPTQVMVVLARTGVGKQAPIWTPIPTPFGYKKMGDIRVGDMVFGSNGMATRVLGVYPQGVRPTYRMRFSDGAEALSGGEHLWQVLTQRGHEMEWTPEVRTTLELIGTDLRRGRGWRWRVPMCAPVEYPERQYPIQPYTLGALIANGGMTNGTVKLTTPDAFVVERVAGEHELRRHKRDESRYCPSFGLPGLIGEIRGLGLDVCSGEKFIPEPFLQGSVEQRIALLQGLMDGDGSGSYPGRSNVLYHTTSPRLADDVIELVNSLGGTAVKAVYDRSRANKPTEYRLTIMLPPEIEPFSFPRKRRGTTNKRMVPHRAIVSIEEVDPEESVCIAVDAADHLYLTGREYVVTHNTLFLLNAMQRIVQVPGQEDTTFLFFSLEQTRGEWWERARRIYRFYNPDSSDRDALDFWRDRLMIVDANKVSPDQVRQAIDDFDYTMGQRPGCVLVDYLGYWAQSFTGERYQRTSDAIMEIKGLAKEQRLRFIVPHQVNRVAGEGQRLDASAGRDSVVGSTHILLSDGSYVSIADLVGQAPELVSVTPEYEFTSKKPILIWRKSVRNDLLRVTTESGRTFTCTPEHPMLTVSDWQPVSVLGVGSRIAVPDEVPVFGTESFPHAELVGHLIADGALTSRPIELTKGDEDILQRVEALAVEAGVIPHRRPTENRTTVLSTPPGKPNPINDLVAGLDMRRRSPDRFVPAALFRAPRSDVAAFLRGLWSDGDVTVRGVRFSTTSECLVREVQHLLSRFGIRSVLDREPYSAGAYRTGHFWRLSVRQADSIERFAAEIGVVGVKREQVMERLLKRVAGTELSKHVDLFPAELLDEVHKVRRANGLGWNVLSRMGDAKRTSIVAGRKIRRDRLKWYAEQVGALRLRRLAMSPLIFERIVNIEAAPPEAVYDATVPGTRSFVGDFVFSNSGVVEETADFLFTLWAEDNNLSKKEEEKDGLIQMQIAKSRHGNKGQTVKYHWAPLSLVMVPQHDRFVQAAKNEIGWSQQRETWPQAVYRHRTGFTGPLSKDPVRPI